MKSEGISALVGRLNRKLAYESKVVGKVPKEYRTSDDEYCIHDCTTGKSQPLGVDELKALAKKLGVS